MRMDMYSYLPAPLHEKLTATESLSMAWHVPEAGSSRISAPTTRSLPRSCRDGRFAVKAYVPSTDAFTGSVLGPLLALAQAVSPTNATTTLSLLMTLLVSRARRYTTE